MKNMISMLCSAMLLFIISCNDNATTQTPETQNAVTQGGQENVNDTISQKDVVKVAIGSKDHTI